MMRDWRPGTAYAARFHGGPYANLVFFAASDPGEVIVARPYMAGGRYARLDGDDCSGEFVWVPKQTEES